MSKMRGKRRRRCGGRQTPRLGALLLRQAAPASLCLYTPGLSRTPALITRRHEGRCVSIAALCACCIGCRCRVRRFPGLRLPLSGRRRRHWSPINAARCNNVSAFDRIARSSPPQLTISDRRLGAPCRSSAAICIADTRASAAIITICALPCREVIRPVYRQADFRPFFRSGRRI